MKKLIFNIVISSLLTGTIIGGGVTIYNLNKEVNALDSKIIELTGKSVIEEVKDTEKDEEKEEIQEPSITLESLDERITKLENKEEYDYSVDINNLRLEIDDKINNISIWIPDVLTGTWTNPLSGKTFILNEDGTCSSGCKYYKNNVLFSANKMPLGFAFKEGNYLIICYTFQNDRCYIYQKS